MYEQRTKPAQLQTFHLFPTLPPEIQYHIWDLAVRPLPGNHHVHAFYVADHYSNQTKLSDIHQADFLHFGRENSFNLAVPRDTPSRGPNRSAYRLDSGLWLACQQSRNALLRYFKSNELWSPSAVSVSESESESVSVSESESSTTAGCSSFIGTRINEHHSQPGVSHTASYIDTAGEEHYITIRSTEDLIHLVDPFALEWFHHYAGDDVPLIDAPARGWGTGGRSPGFLGQNIALDFDPTWLEGVPGDVVDLLEVLYEDALKTVWFIDRRLRRRCREPTSSAVDAGAAVELSKSHIEEETQVFCSWGYIFTEVKRMQQGLWEVEDKCNSAGSVFDVFDRIPSDTNGRLELESPDRLRVLACEEVPL